MDEHEEEQVLELKGWLKENLDAEVVPAQYRPAQTLTVFIPEHDNIVTVDTDGTIKIG